MKDWILEQAEKAFLEATALPRDKKRIKKTYKKAHHEQSSRTQIRQNAGTKHQVANGIQTQEGGNKRIYRTGRRLKWFHSPFSKDGDFTSGTAASLRRRRTWLYTSNLWRCRCCSSSFCRVCMGDESAASQLPQLSVASSIAIQRPKTQTIARKPINKKVEKGTLRRESSPQGPNPEFRRSR